MGSKRQWRFKNSITVYLQLWNQGDDEALKQLVIGVYDELKMAAVGQIQKNEFPQSICPTELIHEVYVRLIESRRMRYENRAQFFWFAGQLMRRILVDCFRNKMAQKRGSGVKHLHEFEERWADSTRGPDAEMVLSLDQGLKNLELIDPRLTRIVELKFFAGLNVIEIAAILKLSESTVKREWKIAKHFLARELGPGWRAQDPVRSAAEALPVSG